MNETGRWVTSGGEFIRDRKWTYVIGEGTQVADIDVLISQTGRVEFRAQVKGQAAVRFERLHEAKKHVHRQFPRRHDAAGA